MNSEPEKRKFSPLIVDDRVRSMIRASVNNRVVQDLPCPKCGELKDIYVYGRINGVIVCYKCNSVFSAKEFIKLNNRQKKSN